MEVITAGTTQSQQVAGKTNHTPEDVNELIRRENMLHEMPFGQIRALSICKN